MDTLTFLTVFIIMYGVASYVLGIYVGFKVAQLTTPKTAKVRVEDLRPRD